jgi:molybdopterin molybdotransferase
MLALDDALTQLLQAVQPLGLVEQVPLLQAGQRVLAQDVVSALNVPSHDNSAMDGYAVRCADLTHASAAQPVRLPVSQRIAAGQVGTALQAGTVARVFTGAPIPAGADAVVMQEHVSLQDGQAVFSAPVSCGQHIRLAGEDVAKGQVALAAGTCLTAAHLGLAASLGHAQLQVAVRPKVMLLTTGDELVMPGAVPMDGLAAGQLFNSNLFALHEVLTRWGCDVTVGGQLPDNAQATVHALAQAAQTHHVVLTSGGVSVGEEDHVKPAVQQLGQLDLWQLAIKPGKPFAFGRLGVAHFVGLPGNPVSSLVTALLLVRPLVLRLQGATALNPVAFHLPAHFSWPKPIGRREFLRVKINAQGGLDLFSNQSSGALTSMSWCDGLVDHPAGQTIAHGDGVRFLPLWAGLGGLA